MSVRTHWLFNVLVQAGLAPEPAEATLDPMLSVDEAWAKAMELFGLDEDTLTALVARRFDLHAAQLENVDPSAAERVPIELAQRFCVAPLRKDGRSIVVATANPTDHDAEQNISFLTGTRPIVEVGSPARIREALQRVYGTEEPKELATPADALQKSESELAIDIKSADEIGRAQTPEVDAEELESGPVVKLANLILRDAVEMRTTDIHIQPTSGGGTVRFRVDGVLRNYMELPLPVLARVTSRIKIIGGMDISDRLRPQDGRARITVRGRSYDLRISSVPTRGLEKTVIRLLDPEGSAKLENLGILPEELTQLDALLRNRNGILLVTGPTGSGKTTTLYGALRKLMHDSVNIMTVEDPVEYELSGLTQIQVETKRGVTFASSLRAILRQDPDIVLVGEIRDAETAEIAVQASLTGHLVLSTLHTNDAVGTVRRLSDLGLDTTAICETLRGAVAQRLARRICSNCAESVTVMTEREEMFSQRFGRHPRVRAVGCDLCGQTGYLGRIPILQILRMTPELEQAVREDAASDEVRRVAEAAGMNSLLESALMRVEAGKTTFDEVERVLGANAGLCRERNECPDGQGQGRPTVVGGISLSASPEGRASASHVVASSEETGAEGSVALIGADTPLRDVVCHLLGDADLPMEMPSDARYWVTPPRLIVADLSGIQSTPQDWLPAVRRLAPDSAILCVGVADAEASLATLLRLGADAVLSNRFHPDAFLAQVESLRQRQMADRSGAWPTSASA